LLSQKHHIKSIRLNSRVARISGEFVGGLNQDDFTLRRLRLLVSTRSLFVVCGLRRQRVRRRVSGTVGITYRWTGGSGGVQLLRGKIADGYILILIALPVKIFH
jgi:hypothetical protein